MSTQFITDNQGNKLAVVLPLPEYNKMLDDLEELEDIKLYDRAKASKEASTLPHRICNPVQPTISICNAIK